jgi:hypothetical protein
VEELRERVKDNPQLSEALDDDSLVAITAYTYDMGPPRERNIYFALNNALRNRRTNPEAFKPWKVLCWRR